MASLAQPQPALLSPIHEVTYTVSRTGGGPAYPETLVTRHSTLSALATAPPPNKKLSMLKKTSTMFSLSNSSSESVLSNCKSVYDSYSPMGVFFHKTCGKGTEASIELMKTRTTGKIIAVKSYYPHKKDKDAHIKSLLEQEHVQKLVHPNIVQHFGMYKVNSALQKARVCQVMEFCEGGDLCTLIQQYSDRLTPSDKGCLFKQLLSAVHYLHSNGLAHRDIKPENVLLTYTGYVKLSDFGLCEQSSGEKSHKLCGSDPYLPPEVFSGVPYDAQKCDVWATGVVMMCIYYGGTHWNIPDKTETGFTDFLMARDAAIEKFAESAKEDSHAAYLWRFRRIAQFIPSKAQRRILFEMLDPDQDTRSTAKAVFDSAWFKRTETCISEDGHGKSTSYAIDAAEADCLSKPVKVIRGHTHFCDPKKETKKMWKRAQKT